MKTIPKKCKGMGKALGFQSCGKEVFKRTYGLCQSCYPNWLLNSDAGKEKLNSSIIQGKKNFTTKARKTENKRKREWKQKHKSIQALIQEARKPFQKYIRQRDEKRPCISCGNFYADVFDAGHYFKAEVFSGLIFEERNVHKQCKKCNRHLSGNEAAYRLGLTNRYGKEFVLELENSADKKRDKIYSREEILEIKEFYKTKLK
tara:strand:- start:2394 stop:3002 length:609 start_codon:yes stop_codon:yes gene_type:complete